MRAPVTSSDEHPSSAARQLPSSRALTIARGLIRTGRASGSEVHGGYLRVTAADGSFYWIPFDGMRLLRGVICQRADELQRGFVDAMARAGAQR
jgi:hypothetical protein